MTADLEQLLGHPVNQGRRRLFTREVGGQRRSEQARRSARASHLAFAAMRRLYPDVYEDLYRQAVVKVNAECGPLPGDVAS